MPSSSDLNQDWWNSIDLPKLLAQISRSVGRRYPWVSKHDLEDAATEALARAVQATHEGRIAAGSDVTAYLVVIAKNLVIDRARRHSAREVPLMEDGSQIPERNDNAIASFINRDAAATDIKRGLAAARKAGDTTAFRVATFLLDEIQRTGRMPTHREAGDELELSHTAVAKALTRFRNHIQATTW